MNVNVFALVCLSGLFIFSADSLSHAEESGGSDMSAPRPLFISSQRGALPDPGIRDWANPIVAMLPGPAGTDLSDEGAVDTAGAVDEESTTVTEDEEPVETEITGVKEDPSDVRPWQPPVFGEQPNALGYSPSAFNVPAGFEDRVRFWVEIYTKYSTLQGVIHDTKYLNVVYTPIDFSVVNKNMAMSEKQKRKAKKQLVKDQKRLIRERLMKLAALKSADGLEGEDLRYWQMFEKISDRNKFREAAQEKRLRFQLGQADRFKQGVYYSGRYLRQMESIFKEEGLPIELTRLPFVESSFNIFARSKVGASGIWQFMRGTARLFRLKMNSVMDERNDPLLATRAAARLLKSNYDMLESWPLALTAYNHGPAGVRKIVTKIGSTDINEIVEKATGRRFGFASENFYACFLAALEVERNAKKYFGEVHWSGELKYETVEIEKAARFSTILHQFDGNDERADTYNPHLTARARLGYQVLPRGTIVRVPAERKLAFVSELESGAEPTVSNERPSHTRRRGKASVGVEAATYRVRRGDTLLRIAGRHGLSLQELMEANDLPNPKTIRRGQVLKIP